MDNHKNTLVIALKGLKLKPSLKRILEYLNMFTILFQLHKTKLKGIYGVF